MDLELNVLPWVARLIADHEHEELAVSAGVGSGKTHGKVQWSIARCLLNKESPKMAFTEPLFRLLRTAAIPTFQKVLHEFGWNEGSDFEINRGAPVPSIKLKRTDQEILLFSSSSPQMIIADEYHSYAMDEAGEVEALAFQNLQARTRCPKAIVRQGLHGGAPQGITHFAEQFGLESEGGPEGWEPLGENDYINKRLSRRRIKLRTFDNPYVNGGDVLGYVQRLYRQYEHNPALIRSYVYGEFCPLYEGSAYKFLPSRHCMPERVEPDPYRPLYLSFDFNSYPMAWVACQIVPYQDELVYLFCEEASEDLHGLDEALFDFCKQFPRADWRDADIRVFGDRSGHAKTHRSKLSDYEYIRRELSGLYNNVSIHASKKVAPEVESIEACNRLFGACRLMCNPDIHGLQRSWQTSRWKDGTRKLHKPSGETWTHRGDAGKYLIYQLEVLDALQVSKPTYGING